MKKGSGRPQRLEGCEFVEINGDKYGYLIFDQDCREWLVSYADINTGKQLLDNNGSPIMAETIENIGWDNVHPYYDLEIQKIKEKTPDEIKKSS